MSLRVMQLVLSLETGGLERLVCDIVHRLDPRVISTIVCCLDELGTLGESLQQEGYPVYVINRVPGLDWKLIPKLSRILQQEKVDVIHAHTYSAYFYGLMAALYNKVKVSTNSPKIVFTVHGRRFYPDRKKIKRIIVNPILSIFTDEIIAVSESTKQSLKIYENFPDHRINIIYNGIDFSQFSKKTDVEATKQSLGLPSETQIIGIIARLDPIKNHRMLLRAFKRVFEQSSSIYLLIVGDGPERQSIEAYAESLGVTNKTLFLGNRSDITELLHILNVFALSSFNEGMSVTLLEAMGAGIPIVATKVGGNPEVIKDQETGFLVQSDDDQEMATMLLKLLMNKEMCQKMGLAGQQRAFTMFSLDKMLNAYTELYLKVSQKIH